MRYAYLYFGMMWVAAAPAWAQPPGKNPFAGQPLAKKSFPDMYRLAVETYFLAEDQYRAGDFEGARRTLDELWSRHPAGGKSWSEEYGEAERVSRMQGALFGWPAAYYALRMLDDCVRHRMKVGGKTPRSETAVLTILIIARAHGLRPKNLKEVAAKTGMPIKLDADPALAARKFKILHDATWLFAEYVEAMTDGNLKLSVRPHVVDLDVEMHAWQNKKKETTVELKPGEFDKVWNAVPQKIKTETDWWWTIYPMLVPPDDPEFAHVQLWGGGITSEPGGPRPMILSNDLWLVRKVPHLGRGQLTYFERRAYFPQWLQHEFFHHLFAVYPEFRLEARDHQWFDRKTWPKDFEGLQEPDYYHEALHRRLKLADLPLHVRLKYAIPPDLLAKLTAEKLVGQYVRTPRENGWHEGSLSVETAKKGATRLRWTNKADVSFPLTPKFAQAILQTSKDSPYFDQAEGKMFRLMVQRGPDGEPVVTGFRYNGEQFLRKKR